MNEGQIHRGRGLVDLIVGVTPTFVDWTNDPTDAADITDGDISTFCTTGDKVTDAAWQYAYFEWDLGALYNVLCTGVGAIGVTAGTPFAYVFFYNGAAWIASHEGVYIWDSGVNALESYSGQCSKVRLGITSNSAVPTTITPNIREFHVWRL